jgi:hypothetical protein
VFAYFAAKSVVGPGSKSIWAGSDTAEGEGVVDEEGPEAAAFLALAAALAAAIRDAVSSWYLV